MPEISTDWAGRQRRTTMHSLPRSKVQAMLVELGQAMRFHEEWYESVMKILVCRLPFDPGDAASQAHRGCAFGKWYYGKAPEELRGLPEFVALETAHERMHWTAATLLQEMAAGVPVRTEDYGAFAKAQAKLRLQLQALTDDLRGILGDLDPLTGARNRTGMLAWLHEQQELARRGVFSCCIAIIDLDHFKAVNDTHGHVAGDKVLAHVARYLMDHIRPYDELFRYGGEEFLLGMPDTDLPTCLPLVDRLREGLEQNSARHDDVPIPCQVSCGIALLDPHVPVERSIERADKAMYRAKADGRNRTRAWGLPV